ncbi:hypothetical protein [Ghiorsea bivora]|uniref:hypothetical protein n=1 Tax=Ghiorsea bivora TaxID=1485545 RepID=UPI00056EC8F2|nr:hypothetical protein [Ghiorsea bivora]
MQLSRKRIPGQRSNITLLITSFWAVLGLFVLIIGHLTIVFFIYGQMKNMDALHELALSMPVLEKSHLYILAGLAIALDIWIVISHKKQRKHKIKR